MELGQALSNFYDKLSSYIAKSNVDIFLREKPIMGRFLDTDRLMRVAGAADIALWKLRRDTFYDLAPKSIKLIVAGQGTAKKPMVAEMLKLYVGEQEYETDDESDAVAVGVAFLIKEGYIDSRIEIQRKATRGRRPKPKIIPKPPKDPTPSERGYVLAPQKDDDISE